MIKNQNKDKKNQNKDKNKKDQNKNQKKDQKDNNMKKKSIRSVQKGCWGPDLSSKQMHELNELFGVNK